MNIRFSKRCSNAVMSKEEVEKSKLYRPWSKEELLKFNRNMQYESYGRGMSIYTELEAKNYIIMHSKYMNAQEKEVCKAKVKELMANPLKPEVSICEEKKVNGFNVKLQKVQKYFEMKKVQKAFEREQDKEEIKKLLITDWTQEEITQMLFSSTDVLIGNVWLSTISYVPEVNAKLEYLSLHRSYFDADEYANLQAAIIRRDNYKKSMDALEYAKAKKLNK